VIFVPVRLAVAELMQALSGLFGLFTGNEVTSAASSWEAFGAALGEIAGGVLEGLATGFAWLVDGVRLFASVIGHLIDGVSALCGWLLDLGGATNEANAAADPFAWSNLGKVLGYVLGLFVAWKAALLAVRGVMVAVSAATKAWAAVQWVLNAAMSANPIGLVVIAIAGLIAAGAWLVQNWDEIAAWWHDLWGGIAAWAGEKWDAITGTITGAWDSIISGITGFGASILSGLQGAWDTASGAASAAWEGIKGIVSGAWDAIVGGIAGFGASLLAGITEAWNAVLEFFGGLNLFESGAKLLSTFVEGIKSMASSVVESVEGVFTKVREYLPFSDAHVGPLSQLTLSGARMMTTLAEG
ncbi:hypothetical protein, partial [Desulfovibrio piger]